MLDWSMPAPADGRRSRQGSEIKKRLSIAALGQAPQPVPREGGLAAPFTHGQQTRSESWGLGGLLARRPRGRTRSSQSSSRFNLGTTTSVCSHFHLSITSNADASFL